MLLHRSLVLQILIISLLPSGSILEVIVRHLIIANILWLFPKAEDIACLQDNGIRRSFRGDEPLEEVREYLESLNDQNLLDAYDMQAKQYYRNR